MSIGFSVDLIFSGIFDCFSIMSLSFPDFCFGPSPLMGVTVDNAAEGGGLVTLELKHMPKEWVGGNVAFLGDVLRIGVGNGADHTGAKRLFLALNPKVASLGLSHCTLGFECLKHGSAETSSVFYVMVVDSGLSVSEVCHRKAGKNVTYLGKVSTTGMQFLSGCTEKPVIELWKKHTLTREDVYPANALLEIRPFQVWLHHLDLKGEATVHMDTFQVARIAYCTADHNVSPNIFAWVYREINDDLSYQMDCHAVECESKLEAKKLAHAMMEAFKKTFHSMKSDGRIHRNSSSEEVSHEFESDDG
ncbi:hypothetical protein BTVI_86003 [Pitangus sulphuratus]|nr:hypothetical protein BTVI_86003 [Pitangus sulphuratus]